MQYEAEHGRPVVEEMPPNHPGYDLLARKAAEEEVVRRIEVKALGGTWEASWATGGNPPKMTKTQFNASRATEDGRHWLYVVENALDDEFWVVYPIQSIAQRATDYLFDHGWKEAADRPAGAGLEQVYEVPALGSATTRRPTAFGGPSITRRR